MARVVAVLRQVLATIPGAPLVLAALVTALVLPTTPPGVVAAVVAIVGLAVAAGRAWRGLLGPAEAAPPWPGWAAGVVAYAVVGLVAWHVFADTLDTRLVWNQGDWSPQAVAVQLTARALEDGRLPTWTHTLSTGDSPLETYPALTYLLAGALTATLDAGDRVLNVLLGLGIAAHLAVAWGLMRLARRFVSWPLVTLVGVLAVVETGSTASGGSNGILAWGLLHNAVGQALFVAALVAVVDAVRRPRLSTSVTIWCTTALACAAHPSMLIGTAGLIVALLVTAALADDVPARRPLLAALHLGLGLALAAAVWMPLGQRLLLYGQHFGTPPDPAGDWLGKLLREPVPRSAFEAAIYLGYAGLLLALWSRKATAVMVALAGGLFVTGLADGWYSTLGLGPSLEVARLGAQRVEALAKPMVYVGFALALGHGVAVARERWPATHRPVVRAALVSVLVLAGVRAGGAWYHELRLKAQAYARAEIADADGFRQLVAWARDRRGEQRPDAFARILVDGPHHGVHLAHAAGLPSVHLTALPDVLLRERIEDGSAASLHRFGVRWAVKQGGPPAHGNPAREQAFGSWFVREVDGWDGQFARIERGAGTVTVTRLDEERIELRLDPAPGAADPHAPALVALGMGYYPRWRARDGAGRPLPLYALPSTEHSVLHVPALWMRPGTVVLTADAALPSDDDGRWLTRVAALLAAAIVVVWSVGPWRRRLLRGAARWRARLRARRLPVRSALVWAAAALVPAAALWSWAGPAPALRLGVGLRGAAEVRYRVGAGRWRPCSYHATLGHYRCDDHAIVFDSMAAVLNDAASSWPYVTPALWLRNTTAGEVELELELEAHLAGSYQGGTSGGAATLEVDGEAAVTLRGPGRPLEYDDHGRRRVVVRAFASDPALKIAVVATSTLAPPRPHLRPPPAVAPASLP
ncbi:MAG: hypothetical protein KA190_03600 [Kofleriaceae bacterium]|nr:hypothetical protein [Kofleriaceae bacterium]